MRALSHQGAAAQLGPSRQTCQGGFGWQSDKTLHVQRAHALDHRAGPGGGMGPGLSMGAEWQLLDGSGKPGAGQEHTKPGEHWASRAAPDMGFSPWVFARCGSARDESNCGLLGAGDSDNSSANSPMKRKDAAFQH